MHEYAVEREVAREVGEQIWTYEDVDKLDEFMDRIKYDNYRLYKGIVSGQVELRRAWIEPHASTYAG